MHLCGAIGGGPSPFSSFEDPSQSEWLAACSAAGANVYPYGDEFVAGFCIDASEGALSRVDSKAACTSTEFPYSCIVDLSGNVAEWENSCDSDAADANCRVRGGTYADEGAEALSCAASATRPRNLDTDNSIGFRCCKSHCD
jgi:formylglycine-generating enzyme required for sulfatase activity